MRKKIWNRGAVPLIPLVIIGVVTIVSAITAIVSTNQLAQRRQTTTTQAASCIYTNYATLTECITSCERTSPRKGTCETCGVSRFQCVPGTVNTPTPTRPPCSANGTTCTINQQCCSNYCNPNESPKRCRTQGNCSPDGYTCTINQQCCSNNCSGGRCQGGGGPGGGTPTPTEKPKPPNCIANGDQWPPNATNCTS